MACSTVAMALMPAPPMPTTCAWMGSDRSPSVPVPGPAALTPHPPRGQTGHRLRPPLPRRRRHPCARGTPPHDPWLESAGVGEQQVELLGQRVPVAVDV